MNDQLVRIQDVDLRERSNPEAMAALRTAIIAIPQDASRVHMTLLRYPEDRGWSTDYIVVFVGSAFSGGGVGMFLNMRRPSWF